MQPSPVWGISLLLAVLSSGLHAAHSSVAVAARDDLGSLVILNSPAERILSLAPDLTEILFHIGAGARLVGVDEYSNYPLEAKQITRVNNHAAANYELILALQPDLVVAWHSGNGEQMISRIRALGFPVFVTEVRKMDDIPGLYRRLGELVGNQKQAEARVAAFGQGLARLRLLYSTRPQVKIFYQIWHEPLITLNAEHILSDVMQLCGGTNIFAQAIPLVPYVNMEAIVAADPQVVILGASQENNYQGLAVWQQWPGISAVANEQIYVLPADLMQRHSMRILDGAELLCGYVEQARQGLDSNQED